MTSRPATGWLIAFVLFLAVMTPASALYAQRGQDATKPNNAFYLGFGPLYAGEYSEALNVFDNVSSSALVSANGRWVDSICYATMKGECYYHMGANAKALEQYNAAVLLYIQHSDWLMRISTDTVVAIGPVTTDPRTSITWGPSARTTAIGKFPDTMLSLQGNSNAENQAVLNKGGTFMSQQYHPVRVGEIARCLALAISRRRQLLGPLGESDPINKNLISALSRRSAPPNHWLGVWVELQLGLAYATAGKLQEAIPAIQRNLTIGGQYDHPLTAIGLMTLGRLALEQKNLEAAETYFAEATFPAIAFGQYDVAAEAFAELGSVQMVSKPNLVSKQLATAAAWRNFGKYNVLKASVMIALAEHYSCAGDPVKAGAALNEARRSMTRNDMSTSRIGARYAYQLALMEYQRGNMIAGSAALNDAVKIQRVASPRIFQTILTNEWFAAGVLTERGAQLLYDNLLREPTDSDWATDPLDTITYQLTPNSIALERWFYSALERKQPELALEIADRIRRIRYFATLPLGGREMALRWILDSPETSLTTDARLQRQDLLTKYPVLKTALDKADEIRGQLKELPAQAIEKEQFIEQEKLVQQLAETVAVMETKLGEVALRRDRSTFLFPPLRTTKELREKMPEKQVVLAFFNSTGGVFAFLFTKEDYVYWKVENPNALKKEVVELFRSMGLLKKDGPIDVETLKDEAWKANSAKLLTTLMPTLKPTFFDNYDELVVVPDGPIWYVPFEMLQMDDGAGGSVSLTDKIRIRYAPLASLSVPEIDKRRRPLLSAIVSGRLYVRDDAEATDHYYKQLEPAFAASARLDKKTPGPTSLLGKTWDNLVVMDDMEDIEYLPYGWSLAQIDKGKPGSDLGSWFPLPLETPQAIYLPGFHTAAEESLKRGGNGDEIFAAVMGTFSGGTQTLALSRWHSGGDAAIRMTAGIGARIDQMPASQAWQEAIAEVRNSPLDAAHEPRVRVLGELKAPEKADHPFFWADMMLIDTGIVPVEEDSP
ncbi:tetratricopeptide repeat protein [Blastopirellula sp. JC732]|uniref:Tetratricopeptide repeat protein n=1 Tax=Blastopirellula sediminis TaxID=2894196 RepID=A0A9X1MJD3_9BACT|nr:tetratricopeptide repeat protein [Blastopirellula sediminis]MCC9609329.1 tetratricopeptide repeat protein [Blastopirellula sediminis]MCC9627894.1 tetratricopeptide repeat protein [Blastopirellula sediminis]